MNCCCNDFVKDIVLSWILHLSDFATLCTKAFAVSACFQRNISSQICTSSSFVVSPNIPCLWSVFFVRGALTPQIPWGITHLAKQLGLHLLHFMLVQVTYPGMKLFIWRCTSQIFGIIYNLMIIATSEAAKLWLTSLWAKSILSLCKHHIWGQGDFGKMRVLLHSCSHRRRARYGNSRCWGQICWELNIVGWSQRWCKHQLLHERHCWKGPECNHFTFLVRIPILAPTLRPNGFL